MSQLKKIYYGAFFFTAICMFKLESTEEQVLPESVTNTPAPVDVAVYRHPAQVVVPILMKAFVDFILYQLESEDKIKVDEIRADIAKQSEIYAQRKQARGGSEDVARTRGLSAKFLNTDFVDKVYSAEEIKIILGNFIEYLILAVSTSKQSIIDLFLNNYQEYATADFKILQPNDSIAENISLTAENKVTNESVISESDESKDL